MDIKWGKVKLGDVARFISTNTLSRDFLSYNEGEILNIHYGDILTKFDNIINFDFDLLPHIQPSVNKVFSIFAKDGDVIIADTAEDETVGKACELQNIGDRKVVSGLHTIWLRFKEGYFAPKYLGYFLNSTFFHKQLLPYMHGTKVTSISKGDLKKVYIYYPVLQNGSPDLNKQEEIAITLFDLDRKIKGVEQEFKKISEIKEGLVQNLFAITDNEV